MVSLFDNRSQAISALQDVDCLPPSEVCWGDDAKQKTCQDLNDADTMDSLDTVDHSDEDAGSDAPESSVEESDALQSEQDDDLLGPVKVVPEGLQPSQDDLAKPVESVSFGLPMYVQLAPSSESLSCNVPPGLSLLGNRPKTISVPVGSSQKKEEVATTCICGRDFALDAKFCQRCGKTRPSVDPSMQTSDREVTCWPLYSGGRNFDAHDEQGIDEEPEEAIAQQDDASFGDIFSMLSYAEPDIEITTFTISGIPQTCSANQFRDIVLGGFKGVIDFLYTPCEETTGAHMNFAVINLVDASHAEALRWALKFSFFECEMVPSQVQGYKACKVFWGSAGDLVSVDTQIKEQFQKTKMCAFFMKGKCLRGEGCVYAHSRAEVQQSPDLQKTRLCQNFLHQKCFKPDCKFAHGQDELRSTEGVYKTVLCKGAMRGSCKSGAACRFAHTPEELRPVAAGRTPIYSF